MHNELCNNILAIIYFPGKGTKFKLGLSRYKYINFLFFYLFFKPKGQTKAEIEANS